MAPGAIRSARDKLTPFAAIAAPVMNPASPLARKAAHLESARALAFATPRNDPKLDAAIARWRRGLADMHLFRYSFRAPFSFCE
jgi:hypothetical protein